MKNRLKIQTLHLLLSLFLFCYHHKIVLGQNSVAMPAGARGIAMGNANLTFRDIHSGFNNQAGLAFIKDFSGVAFVENRFLLSELQSGAISIAHPTTSGTIGLVMQYFGFEGYNEQKIGINYSRILFDKLSIGAQFDLLNTRIKEYGNDTALTFEVGLQYEIWENIITGIHVFNPVRANIGGEDIPSILQIGLTYQIAEFLTISSSVEKDTFLPYNVRVGLEYQLLQKIYFRAGVNSNPNKISFGLGYLVNQLQLNIAASYHNVLGFSPSFGISFMPQTK